MSAVGSLPFKERVRVGMGFGSVVGNGCGCHERALWPRGASHFLCFAKESNWPSGHKAPYALTQSTKYRSTPLSCSITSPCTSVSNPGSRVLNSRANLR